MNKFAVAAVLSTLATFAVIPYSAHAAETVGVQAEAAGSAAKAAPVRFSTGQIVFDVSGKALGEIYSVSRLGSPVVMVRGTLVTVPLDTLSKVKGKLTTSLTAQALLAKR